MSDDSHGGDWADVVTNLVSLAPDQFEANINGWLGFGTAPREQLPVFIHEMTHHWCFLSPVGSALAALSLRIRRRILQLASTEDEVLENALLDDLVRYRVGMMALRPLAEGLASFAEFDATSRKHSSVLSPVMQWVGLLFMDAHAYAALQSNQESARAFDLIVAKVIGELRHSPTALNRKLRVLLHPFASDAGGYLNGYLTLKSLWRSMGRSSVKTMNESDLSLMYLRGFFYDDLEMVRLLLTPEGDPRHSGAAILTRLNDRLEATRKVQPTDVDAYEQAVLADRGGLLTPWPGLLLDSNIGSACQKLFDSILEDIYSEDGLEGQMFGYYSRVLFLRRTLLDLGSFTADVTIANQEVFVVTSSGQLKLEALPEAVTGHGLGEVQLLASMSNPPICRALVVALDHKIVACRIIGLRESQKAMRDLVEASFMSRATIQGVEAHVAQFEASVVKHPNIKVNLEDILTQARNLVDAIYRDTAMRFAFEPGERRSHAAVDHIADTLRSFGLRGLSVDGRRISTREVKGMALLGMCCSINPWRIWQEPAFKQHGIDLQETLEAMRFFHREIGFPPEPLELDGCIYTTI